MRLRALGLEPARMLQVFGNHVALALELLAQVAGARSLLTCASSTASAFS